MPLDEDPARKTGPDVPLRPSLWISAGLSGIHARHRRRGDDRFGKPALLVDRNTAYFGSRENAALLPDRLHPVGRYFRRLIRSGREMKPTEKRGKRPAKTPKTSTDR